MEKENIDVKSIKVKLDKTDFDVVIIGGGLAGLVNAILLNRKNIAVLLIEKREYPFHRVCGEYISNEVRPFLERNGMMPDDIEPSSISKFQLSSLEGKTKTLDLDLGGFGISRYSLDHHLVELAKSEGVMVHHDQVDDVSNNDKGHIIQTKKGNVFIAAIVIGAFGKRSTIDKHLKRSFIEKSSPYVGVKYHIRHDYPKDLVALHNFPNGYCGINAIEDDKYNLCYLMHRNNLKKYKDIGLVEKNILSKNPQLAKIFNEAEFIFEKPEVINEITFETKTQQEKGIFMCGDAAGMITPLCGNGMAIAIHSAKILSEHLTDYFANGKDKSRLEEGYKKVWNQQFKTRLAVGRTVQKLFGKGFQSSFSLALLEVKPLANFIIRNTHGKPI